MINFICEMSANLAGREHLLVLVRLCYSQNDEVVVVNASVFSLSVPAQLIWAEYTCIFVPGLQQCYRMERAHELIYLEPIYTERSHFSALQLAHLKVQFQ